MHAGMGLAAIGLLFEYLAMLRREGPQQWVYQELADIGSMKSRYLEEEDATDYVTAVSSNMLSVQPQHVLLSDYLYEDWDPALVSVEVPEDMQQESAVEPLSLQNCWLGKIADLLHLIAIQISNGAFFVSLAFVLGFGWKLLCR